MLSLSSKPFPLTDFPYTSFYLAFVVISCCNSSFTRFLTYDKSCIRILTYSISPFIVFFFLSPRPGFLIVSSLAESLFLLYLLFTVRRILYDVQ